MPRGNWVSFPFPARVALQCLLGLQSTKNHPLCPQEAPGPAPAGPPLGFLQERTGTVKHRQAYSPALQPLPRGLAFSRKRRATGAHGEEMEGGASTFFKLPVICWRKVGITSSRHDPYGLGYTRVTMVITKGGNGANRSKSPKITLVRIVLCNSRT